MSLSDMTKLMMVQRQERQQQSNMFMQMMMNMTHMQNQIGIIASNSASPLAPMNLMFDTDSPIP